MLYVMREATLFIHLISMAIYFMTLGVEAMVLSKMRKADDGGFSILRDPLAAAIRWQQYAMLLIFFTGGYLITGVKKEDRISFFVTIGVFVLLGALSGMVSGRYRRATAEDFRSLASSLVSNLYLRAGLSAAIVFMVSLKPDLTRSVAVTFIFAVIGGVLSRLGSASARA